MLLRHLWLMRHPILACTLTNGFQQLVQYASSVFPAKITGVRLQLCLKPGSKGPSSGNFLATGGFIERNTYHIMALGC